MKLIEAEKAKDVIHEYFKSLMVNGASGVDVDRLAVSIGSCLKHDANLLKAIDELPSEQPETNCSEFPNNSDTISRQQAIDALKEKVFHNLSDEFYGAMQVLDELPSAQPERMRGKWIERNPQNSDKCRLIECDQCGFSHIVGFNVPYEHWIENRNFCERCGADMRGETNG